MTPQINVEIDLDGNVKFTGEGFQGNSCNAAMEALESSISSKSQERVNKASYYDSDPTESATLE